MKVVNYSYHYYSLHSLAGQYIYTKYRWPFYIKKPKNIYIKVSTIKNISCDKYNAILMPIFLVFQSNTANLLTKGKTTDIKNMLIIN